MPRKGFLLLAAIVIFGTVIAVARPALDRHRESVSPHMSYFRAKVIRVLDGDTLLLRSRGRNYRVDLIGIDAPEREQCFGARATAAARRLAAGREVRVAVDPTQVKRDRHRRLLAYVLISSRRDLGEELVRNGAGRVFMLGRPFAKLRAYRAAASAARRNSEGVWRACRSPAAGPPPPWPRRADGSGIPKLTPNTDPHWRGDYETGDFSQWAHVQGPLPKARIVTRPVREGRYAARFEVSPGDRPDGLAYGELVMVYQHIRHANQEIRERAGQESWWGWSTYFGSDFNPNPRSFWNDFVEFHNTGSSQANIHFELDTTTKPWHFSLRSFGGKQDQNQNRFDLGPFQRNRWLDFIFGVRWATDNTGWVEVWLNGRQVVPRTMIPTIYEGQFVYVMQGFYRDRSQLTTVLYHDAMRRKDTLEQVLAR